MHIALTALILLGALAALLRGLRNGFYAAHVAGVAVLAFLLELRTGPVELFAERALLATLLLHLTLINGIVFWAYAHDKRAAERKTWRVPERTLHALTLIGGTPAAWWAQRTLRHKTKKSSFRVVFWLVVAVQVLAMVALMVRMGMR